MKKTILFLSILASVSQNSFGAYDTEGLFRLAVDKIDKNSEDFKNGTRKNIVDGIISAGKLDVMGKKNLKKKYEDLFGDTAKPEAPKGGKEFAWPDTKMKDALDNKDFVIKDGTPGQKMQYLFSNNGEGSKALDAVDALERAVVKTAIEARLKDYK